MIDVYEVRDAIDTIQRFCGQSTRCVDCSIDEGSPVNKTKGGNDHEGQLH